jgi:hypothetical protein
MRTHQLQERRGDRHNKGIITQEPKAGVAEKHLR